MSKQTVHVSRTIEAPRAKLYAVIADYSGGHNAILPKPYFDSMTIEKGGTGAGTTIRLKMIVTGQTFHYHQVVSEPEPGHVIVETDLNTGLSSRFTFDSLNDSRTRVTISSEFMPSPGVKGAMERLFTPMMMQRIFQQELRNLEAYVKAS